MRVLVASLLVAATAGACASSRTSQATHAELLDILGVQTWRLPALDGHAEEWTIDLVDYRPLDPGGRTVFDVLGSRKGTLLSLRPTAEDDYEFVMMQARGTSSGELRLSACDSDEAACDTDITWEPIPLCTVDCGAFVLADIQPMIGTRTHKQLVVARAPVLTAASGAQ